MEAQKHHNKKGYIHLWRQIEDNPIWDKNRVFSKAEAWIDILMQVQGRQEPQEILIGMKKYTCHRGESLKSMETWAERWHWSRSKVRRFLNLLQSCSMIVFKTNTRTTHLTVCNYDSYNPLRTSNEHQTNIKRTSNEHQTNTDNKGNKGNKGNKDNKEDDMFNKFWEAYPKKQGKIKAMEKWKKAKNKTDTETILKAIAIQKKSNQWQKDDGQYIPMPATWLYQERWNDEIRSNTSVNEKKFTPYKQEDV